MTLAIPAVGWAAAGARWGLEALLARGRRAWALGGVLCLCAILMADACQSLRTDKVYRKEFGLWLAGQAEPDAWIATLSKPEIAYYANRRGINWAPSPGFFLEHPKKRQMPQLLILDLETDDQAWVSSAYAIPQFARVPLPVPYGARFAVFRRDWAAVLAHPIIPTP